MREYLSAERVVFRGALSLLAVAFCLRPATAQTAFDVASVRPSAEGIKFEGDGKIEASHGTVRMHEVRLSTCIHWAYGVPSSQIIGSSPLLTETRYEIVAKASEDVPDPQLRQMMQTLLKERFKLIFHRDRKKLDGVALTTAKTGSKLRPSAHQIGPGSEMERASTSTGMTARSITMQEFAAYLSGPLEVPIVDDTGLPGRYDLTLDYTPYVGRYDKGDLFSLIDAALQEELGLKLVHRKALADILIVDHVEPPSSN